MATVKPSTSINDVIKSTGNANSSWKASTLSNDVYKSAGNANSSSLLFPHYIVMYSLLFLVCSAIIIVIIHVYKYNVSIKKRLNRLEHPIFIGLHSIPQPQLNSIERRLNVLESSVYYTERRINSMQTTETSNEYLNPIQRQRSMSDLSWDSYDNYERVYNSTTVRL